VKAIVQRVSEARVDVDGVTVGRCGAGLMILVCAMRGESEASVRALADRIAKLRIFRDDAGKMNRSLLDIRGTALVVSQFTLAADTSRGNRPGFSGAEDPKLAETFYDYFATCLRAKGIETETGVFGADMAVHLVNDGPVTIAIET